MKPQIGEALTAPQSPVIFYLRLSGILSLTQRKPLRHRAGMSMTLGHTACERPSWDRNLRSPALSTALAAPSQKSLSSGWGGGFVLKIHFSSVQLLSCV